LNHFVNVARDKGENPHVPHGQHLGKRLRNGPAHEDFNPGPGDLLDLADKALIKRLLVLLDDLPAFDFQNHHLAGHVKDGRDSSVPC
jgi:hypothetical protein